MAITLTNGQRYKLSRQGGNSIITDSPDSPHEYKVYKRGLIVSASATPGSCDDMLQYFTDGTLTWKDMTYGRSQKIHIRLGPGAQYNCIGSNNSN